MSCQQYGTDIFTFYWNDMGGNATYGDDLDYNNGSVRIQCSGATFIVINECAILAPDHCSGVRRSPYCVL